MRHDSYVPNHKIKWSLIVSFFCTLPDFYNLSSAQLIIITILLIMFRKVDGGSRMIRIQDFDSIFGELFVVHLSSRK